MISDDVVWLAHAIDQYISATGDDAILSEQVPFLEGAQLQHGQHDSFFLPGTAAETTDLYEHAARALDLAIDRTGAHGLPLILGGDWNDGMNRVGIEGRGESVWLGWLLAATLERFKAHAEKRCDRNRSTRWSDHLTKLKTALETTGWDGIHYRRGFFDDGSALGSNESRQCQIDSIAQSWSVLSGVGDPAHIEKALESAVSRLVDTETGIVRLFTPPFEKAEVDPGYIGAYPPGVRENGGQYTHAAIWLGLALLKAGRLADAWRVFELLNPIHHALTAEEAERYRVEPYVVAADIYGGDGYAGRGGWTWYTGSAGWLYRFAVEGFLGIRRKGSNIVVSPALPEHWQGYKAKVEIDGRKVDVAVTRTAAGYDVMLDGQPQEINLQLPEPPAPPPAKKPARKPRVKAAE